MLPQRGDGKGHRTIALFFFFGSLARFFLRARAQKSQLFENALIKKLYISAPPGHVPSISHGCTSNSQHFFLQGTGTDRTCQKARHGTGWYGTEAVRKRVFGVTLPAPSPKGG
jgi:hypothetical protein